MCLKTLSTVNKRKIINFSKQKKREEIMPVYFNAFASLEKK